MNRTVVVAASAALTLAAAGTPANAWTYRTSSWSYDDCVCSYRYTWGAWDDPYYWRRPLERRIVVDVVLMGAGRQIVFASRAQSIEIISD